LPKLSNQESFAIIATAVKIYELAIGTWFK